MKRILEKKEYIPDGDFPFDIQRYTIGREHVIPSHTHDFYELVYVVSGSALHEMSGHTYQLRSGDVFVLEPDAYHRYQGSANDDTIVYNVLFETSFLHREIGSLLRLPSFIEFFYLSPFLRKSASFVPFIRLNEVQSLQILDNLQKIHKESTERQEGYRLVIKTRWIECLILLSRFHQNNLSGSHVELSDKERVESVRHLVEHNYRQSFSLEQLSRLCGMSVSSFTAKFREITSMSMLDYRQSVQIKHACDLLETTNKKVLDIALETGFNDISFFNKVFRRHTGLPPNGYRNRGPHR
jgi:AraC-like DNA-binding protein/quercetin dioxygenase-like cupin family protein